MNFLWNFPEDMSSIEFTVQSSSDINLENKFEFDVLTNADVNSTFIIICFQPSKSPLREARQLNIERDWNFYWRYAALSHEHTHFFVVKKFILEQKKWCDLNTLRYTFKSERLFLKEIWKVLQKIKMLWQKMLINYEKSFMEFFKARVIIWCLILFFCCYLNLIMHKKSMFWYNITFEDTLLWN